jgi:hypothetical protein
MLAASHDPPVIAPQTVSQDSEVPPLTHPSTPIAAVVVVVVVVVVVGGGLQPCNSQPILRQSIIINE